jgi:hypothetical protein
MVRGLFDYGTTNGASRPKHYVRGSVDSSSSELGPRGNYTDM